MTAKTEKKAVGKKKMVSKIGTKVELKDKRPEGRPPKPIPNGVFKAICDRIASGEWVETVCPDMGIPVSHFYDELKRSQEFSEAYARTSAPKASALRLKASQVFEIEPPMNAMGNYDSAYVSYMNHKANNFHRVADCIDPPMTKQRTELSGKDGGAMDFKLSISPDLAEFFAN